MPITLLLVEGNLDSEILSALFQGSPVVRRGGSKNSLKPQARYEHEQNRVIAGYIRDRDFDFDPPDDLDAPTIDSCFRGTTLGWRWSRHEMENYLLDSAIVANAVSVSQEEWSTILVEAAARIRWYEIARWTVGQLRRHLPPQYELQTRPSGIKEFQIPKATDERASRDWCMNSIHEFAKQVESLASPETIREKFQERTKNLSEELLSDATQVLVWCSGKDLLAALTEPTLRELGFNNARMLQVALRDWILDNIEESRSFFQEWESLIEQVRDVSKDSAN